MAEMNQETVLSFATHQNGEDNIMDDDSNIDSTESESEKSETSDGGDKDITDEIRSLYECDKGDIIVELIKNRIHEARLERQVYVYQQAVEHSLVSNAILELDLTHSKHMLINITEAIEGRVNSCKAALRQYNDVEDMVAMLDTKRAQYLKDIQCMESTAALCHTKLGDIVNIALDNEARAEAECELTNEMENKLEELISINHTLKQQLIEEKDLEQAQITSNAEQLNNAELALAKLRDDLAEAERHLALVEHSNTLLKDNADAVLVEKTQFSEDVDKLQATIQDTQKKAESKLADMEEMWRNRIDLEIQQMNAEFEPMLQKEEIIKADIAKLNETIEKLGRDLSESQETYVREKLEVEDLDSKNKGMTAIIEERNKEICSLHAKLNSEQKHFNERREELQRTLTQTKDEFEKLEEVRNQKSTKVQQLEMDLMDHDDKVKEIEAQIKLKDNECLALADQLKIEEHAQTRMAQLEAALADQINKVAQMMEANDQNQVNTDVSEKMTIGQAISTTSSDLGTPSSDIDAMDPSRIDVHPENMQPIPREASERNRNNELNFSFASTINLDEEPLENNNTSVNSSVRLVKPFFRKTAD